MTWGLGDAVRDVNVAGGMVTFCCVTEQEQRPLIYTNNQTLTIKQYSKYVCIRLKFCILQDNFFVLTQLGQTPQTTPISHYKDPSLLVSRWQFAFLDHFRTKELVYTCPSYCSSLFVHTHTTHTHTHTHTNTHTHKHTQIHTHKHKHTLTQTHTQTRTHTNTQTRTHTNTHTNTHTHKHTHKHAHTQTHKHTHTHTHTQTRTHTNTHKYTHTNTNTHSHKHTNTHTHKHTQIHTHKHKHTLTQTHTHMKASRQTDRSLPIPSFVVHHSWSITSWRISWSPLTYWTTTGLPYSFISVMQIR